MSTEAVHPRCREGPEELETQNLGFRVTEFRVQGFGFRVSSFTVRVGDYLVALSVLYCSALDVEFLGFA